MNIFKLYSVMIQTLYTPLKTVILSSMIAKALQITEMPFIMYLYAYEKGNIDFMSRLYWNKLP